MKWTMYQVLVIPVLIFLMWLLEKASQLERPESTGEWVTVYSPVAVLLVIGSIVTLIYLLFLFEAKKERSFFKHPIWKQMPKITIGLGVVSSILFIIGGTAGPINEWVEAWRSILYLFMIYFLFLVYLFIFSIEMRKERSTRQYEKTAHIAYFWVLILFIAIYFVF